VVWSALALAATALAPANGAAEELLVGAAVSLREPLTDIAGDFEMRHP
jgi:ABC-type molybdate transport system substrate-binding protein